MAVCTEGEIQQNVLSSGSYPTISYTGIFTWGGGGQTFHISLRHKTNKTLQHLRSDPHHISPPVSWQTEYRNKCEFLISVGADGEDKTIGFRLGKYKGGSCAVVGPADTCHVSVEAKRVVSEFQKFIRYDSVVVHSKIWTWKTELLSHPGNTDLVFSPVSLSHLYCI